MCEGAWSWRRVEAREFAAAAKCGSEIEGLERVGKSGTAVRVQCRIFGGRREREEVGTSTTQ
jgi:ribosomal protein S28E/S33